MIKSIDFPDRIFETKDELFDALRESNKIIIDSKKCVVYKSIDKGCGVTLRPLTADKFETTDKAVKFDSNYWYIVMNTTNILDSHKDLHIPGLWNKSVKERQNKNYIVDSHELSLKATIAKKEYVELILLNTTFSKIGINYDGNTQALIYKVAKNKIIDEKAKQWLESGDEIQGSVRMQYEEINLAMNSTNPNDAEYKKLFDDYIDVIANKKDIDEEISYFWVVKRAKNTYESSLVLFGSNSSTGTISETKDNNYEPSSDTQNNNKDAAVNSDTVATFKELLTEKIKSL